VDACCSEEKGVSRIRISSSIPEETSQVTGSNFQLLEGQSYESGRNSKKIALPTRERVRVRGRESHGRDMRGAATWRVLLARPAWISANYQRKGKKDSYRSG